MSEQVSQDRFHVFYSVTPSMQVIDTKGQPIVFIAGRFHTKNADQIAFLQKMIADGSQAVSVNPDQLTMSADDLDPMEALKKKFIAEYLEQQAQQLSPEANVTESKQEPLNAASTTSIAPVAAGGGQTALASITARLAAAKVATPAN